MKVLGNEPVTYWSVVSHVEPWTNDTTILLILVNLPFIEFLTICRKIFIDAELAVLFIYEEQIATFKWLFDVTVYCTFWGTKFFDKLFCVWYVYFPEKLCGYCQYPIKQVFPDILASLYFSYPNTSSIETTFESPLVETLFNFPFKCFLDCSNCFLNYAVVCYEGTKFNCIRRKSVLFT